MIQLQISLLNSVIKSISAQSTCYLTQSDTVELVSIYILVAVVVVVVVVVLVLVVINLLFVCFITLPSPGTNLNLKPTCNVCNI